MSDIMGFNKRWIDIDSITGIYKREGIEGVKQYLNTPDAIIITDELSEIVLDTYHKDDDKRLIKEIEKCILTEKK